MINKHQLNTIGICSLAAGVLAAASPGVAVPAIAFLSATAVTGLALTLATSLYNSLPNTPMRTWSLGNTFRVWGLNHHHHHTYGHNHTIHHMPTAHPKGQAVKKSVHSHHHTTAAGTPIPHHASSVKKHVEFHEAAKPSPKPVTFAKQPAKPKTAGKTHSFLGDSKILRTSEAPSVSKSHIGSNAIIRESSAKPKATPAQPKKSGLSGDVLIRKRR